jgi:predicted O-methyltransferase YrrM
MRNRFILLFRFIRFYLSAKTKYKVHSPFVFHLFEQVFDDQRNFYAFGEIEWLRSQLKSNPKKIKVTDLGAGSLIDNNQERSISAIASSALSGPWQSQVLFKLINRFQPETMLELGTSLGLSALYQSAARQNAKMITLEGCPQIAAIAKIHFDQFSRNNIEIRVGAFRQTLDGALQDLRKLDYAFIDGHHQMEPTLNYFEKCLLYSHENTLLVFDDIHWSKEMEAAWEEIKNHPKVNLTIDLFYMGLVFFRKEQKEKEHFRIVPTRWKPWQMGFFSS